MVVANFGRYKTSYDLPSIRGKVSAMPIGKTMKKVLAAFGSAGVVRAKDFAAKGIHRKRLADMVYVGFIDHVGHGLYRRHAHQPTQHHALVQASVAVPGGNICLLSALWFHGMTTRLPRQVWLAIDSRSWKPTIKQPKIRFVRVAGHMHIEDLDPYTIEGVKIYVYSPARTVVDCFRYRRAVGIEVAMDAMQAFFRRRDASMGDLLLIAKRLRVLTPIKPYLEALAHRFK